MKWILFIAVFFFASCAAASAQIYHVAEMNTEQIRALDKQKTVVILTGGILEQHGPHLPSYSDGYYNEWLTRRLAEAIVTRPGYAALIFPTIPLGTGAANELGGKHVFPGSYTVRSATLRAVFMDLATELGEQGFRWIFLNHAHGSPFHSRALEQASGYFRDTYGGAMVHLFELEPTKEQYEKARFTATHPEPVAADLKEIGAFDLHAGFEETSIMLFLRPDLVSPVYKQLPPLPANRPGEQFPIARAEGWAGYIGSPRLATASFGALSQQHHTARDVALAFAILDGVIDEREIPRRITQRLANKELMKELEGSSRYEAEVERRQREWLKKKGIE